jgi:acetyl-CoA carboxylase biotin carboxylase subunit
MMKMGNKVEARKIMREIGPVLPGSDEALKNKKAIFRIAREIGYPLIIKAAAGGGGIGMRIVENEEQLLSSLETAKMEAESAFGNPEVYIEKYIHAPRHIEIQILADSFGNVIHLGERECSIQRKYQKLIEEAPSPAMNPKLRRKMGEFAKKGVRKINYVGVGTVEFLLDREEKFYFMEMNTRIQVEHPVTEFVTGVDIIKEQIRIAAGEPLSLSQKDIQLRGHAIECRINAEDPDQDFLPSPNKITIYHAPGGPGVRVDSHIYQEYEIPNQYDSLISKLIVYGRDRMEAISRMQRALDEYIIEGVKTTIPFHQKVLRSKEFLEGKIHTRFIEEFGRKR